MLSWYDISTAERWRAPVRPETESRLFLQGLTLCDVTGLLRGLPGPGTIRRAVRSPLVKPAVSSGVRQKFLSHEAILIMVTRFLPGQKKGRCTSRNLLVTSTRACVSDPTSVIPLCANTTPSRQTRPLSGRDHHDRSRAAGREPHNRANARLES